MELRQLRHFAAVARYGNFSRAAEHLNLTQPALSRQVKNLENELGIALLKRRENGVSLTTAGEVFLEEARAILAQTDQAIRLIQKKTSEVPLRVGYLSAFVAGIIPSALAQFKATVMAAVPELLHLRPQEIVSKANRGELTSPFFRKSLRQRYQTFSGRRFGNFRVFWSCQSGILSLR